MQDTESTHLQTRHINHTRIYTAICKLLSGRGEEVDWASFTTDNWFALARRAEAEGVAPLVYKWIAGNGQQAAGNGQPATFNFQPTTCDIPDAVLTQLKAGYYRTAAHNALLFRELERVLAAFEQAQIPVILLKGAALAQTIYPDPALRPMGDLDLLVKTEHLRRAVKVIQSIGFFVQKITARVVLERQSINLDLHWSLIEGDSRCEPRPIDWFWQQTIPFSQGKALTLTPSANFLHLTAHYMIQHRRDPTRLLRLYDIYLLLDRFGGDINWAELREHALKFGWSQSLDISLQDVQSHFPGTRLSTSLPETNTLDNGLVRNASTTHSKGKASSILDALSVLDWHTRFNFLVKIIFPSPTYMRWRYKPPLRWLWPLYYPYRWLDMLFAVSRTWLKIG